MSKTKRYLEEISSRYGFDGEINDEVLRLAEDLSYAEQTKETEKPETKETQ